MRAGRARLVPAFIALVLVVSAGPSAEQPPTRAQLLSAMKRATVFMVEKVSTGGGYVWSYLPDLSRRWGELEARPTMIWIQPPGTPTMGHLFLDAYHAAGDEYYYQAAEKVGAALARAQHPSGGWHYLADFGGERSRREWYATIGRNAWRLEEFQHDWGNATFDDAGTAQASRFLLRLYLEKRDARYKASLDKAIGFFLDSQYPSGAWPQRFPPAGGPLLHGRADYTSYLTFNDDVASENVDFLLLCYRALGDRRLLEPIRRGMNAFLATQGAPPQPGWALQYTRDLRPAGARTYEPAALATHTTASNIQSLVKFYRLTGDAKFLARVPDAIDWLERLTLPPGVAPPGRTHPTFVELGTNRPLYVHRSGSNVVNGRYYVDSDPRNTIGHYSSFRRIDVPGLRRMYDEARAVPPERAAKNSPLAEGGSAVPLPKYFVVDPKAGGSAAASIGALNEEGYWPSPLGTNSHAYRGEGSKKAAPGDFSTTQVGDETDTSPFPDAALEGISTAGYIRNMGVLIRALDESAMPAAASPAPATPIVWSMDSLERIGGHAVTVVGRPRVVETPAGRAVEFDGKGDGLFVDVNPLAGLERFTLEVVFEPASDGGPEQRFVHVEEAGTGNRALIELRLSPGGTWCLDTFLRHGDASLTLLERTTGHPAGTWHAAALTFDGRTMTHYVDGVREASGPVAFEPLRSGRTSIGVRQNLASWFKGRIRTIRVTPEVLPAAALMRADGEATWARGVEGQRKAASPSSGSAPSWRQRCRSAAGSP